MAELEDETHKNRDRVTRLYARLKAEERAREKARKAVAVAGQLLDRDEHPPRRGSRGPRWSRWASEPEPGSSDEPAVA